MKKFPNKYKPIDMEIRQQSSPMTIVGLAWFYAVLLGLYFNDELQLAVSNSEADAAPLFGTILKKAGDTVALSKLKNDINGSAQYLYQQEYRFGTKVAPPLPEEPVTLVQQTTAEEISMPIEDTPPIEELPIPPEIFLPTNVLLVGSSSMRSSMGAALSKLLKQSAKVLVHRHARIGTGLARPDVYNWHQRTHELIEQHNVDLVVAQFIGNDCQNLVNDDLSVEATLNSAQWGKAYQERIRSFILSIQDKGVEVVLIGMPIVRSPRFRRRLAYANDLVAEVAKETNTLFIPTWDVTTNDNGEYQESIRVDGRTLKFRHEDGIHLSHAGSQYVARDIYAQLIEQYPWESNSSVSSSVSIPAQIRQ